MKLADIKLNIKKFLGAPSAAKKSITQEGILIMNPQNLMRLKNLGYSNATIAKMVGVSPNTIWNRVQELKKIYKSMAKKKKSKKGKGKKKK